MKNNIKLLAVIMALVVVTICAFPAYAANDKFPMLGEQFKDKFKTSAILTMYKLQEQGRHEEARNYGKMVYGNDFKTSQRLLSNEVLMVQYDQETNYYCGPAACKSVISVRTGNNIPSQTTLAYELGTTSTDGTDFSSTIATVIDSYINSSKTYSIKYCDSFSVISSLIKSDINNGYGVIANGISVPNTDSYIKGYPTNRTIYHYVAIYGYDNYNKVFKVCEPAHGQPGFNVERRHDIKYPLFMKFIEERGIVW